MTTTSGGHDSAHQRLEDDIYVLKRAIAAIEDQLNIDLGEWSMKGRIDRGRSDPPPPPPPDGGM